MPFPPVGTLGGRCERAREWEISHRLGRTAGSRPPLDGPGGVCSVAWRRTSCPRPGAWDSPTRVSLSPWVAHSPCNVAIEGLSLRSGHSAIRASFWAECTLLCGCAADKPRHVSRPPQCHRQFRASHRPSVGNIVSSSMSGESGGLSDIQLIDERHPPQARGQLLRPGWRGGGCRGRSWSGEWRLRRAPGRRPSRNARCPGQASRRRTCRLRSCWRAPGP